MSRRITLIFLVLSLTGCNSLTSVLRDELAIESEIVDQATFVVNEATAKRFLKTYGGPTFTDDMKRRDTLKEEQIGNLEMSQGAWVRYTKILKEVLDEPVDDEALKKVDALGKPGQPAKLIAEIKNRLEADKKLPTDWNKCLAELPKAEFLGRYMREKLALKIARHREANRLGGIIKAANNATPELDRVVTFLKRS